MTKYEFLQKVRDIHGFKYMYPTLKNKILHTDSIDITFADKFYTQKVCKHLMGRCPEKNTPSSTTEEFIKKAKEEWGDKYDYSLVEYNGALKKVKIIYDGIIFEQIASSHLIGLAVESNLNLDYFIKKAKEKWSDRYDYSLVVYKNCKEKVKIILNETGVIYEQTPYQHLISNPENKTMKSNTSDFINRSNQIHNFKYDYSKTKYEFSSDKVIIICPEHGEFEQVANSHLRGMSCKKCGDKYKNREYQVKYTTKEFIMEAKDKWGDKYDYSITEYKNARSKLRIIYDGIIYEQLPASHLKYPVEGFLNQEIFLIKARRKWGDKYNYSLTKYISTKIPVKIIFEEEVYEQLPHNHLIYAPELRNSLSLEEFIDFSKKTHSRKYNYDKVTYINSQTKVVIVCPFHGDFNQMPQSHMSGRGCKKCSDSQGEKKIRNFLEKSQIDFFQEHIFLDCRNKSPLRFDFYIPSKRTLIEFDGIEHFQPIEHFGGLKSYEQLKINDKIKNDYCEENYINLIRIRYDQIDKIEEILKNNLA